MSNPKCQQRCYTHHYYHLQNGIRKHHRKFKNSASFNPTRIRQAPHAPCHPHDIHHTPQNQPSNNKKYHTLIQQPANIAKPCFGSDAATREPRASLRAAVLHRPLLALKISTALLTVPAKRHKRSATQAQPPPPSTQNMLPPHLPNNKAHATRRTINPPTNNHKSVIPPAKIANP